MASGPRALGASGDGAREYRERSPGPDAAVIRGELLARKDASGNAGGGSRHRAGYAPAVVPGPTGAALYRAISAHARAFPVPHLLDVRA